MQNKHGSGRDVILIVFLMFTISISFFISNYTGKTLETQIAASEGWNKADVGINATTAMNATIDKGNAMWDKVIFAVFIGLVLSLIVTSWIVGGNPVFMIFYFIFIIIAVISSIIFSDAFMDIFYHNVYFNFGTTWADFPITMNLLTYFPYYITIVGVIGMIIMFAKPQEAGL
jgi:hypothetical protein